MQFDPRYYADRLHLIHPAGDIGVVTLWTPVPTALSYLARLGVDLHPETSRLAVVANLYGDGLPQMIRNLLWNPQITTLLVFGQDLSGSAQELTQLLTVGVEPVERLGQARLRIIGTERCLDTGFPPDALVGAYRVVRLGKPGAAETDQGIRDTLALPPFPQQRTERIDAPLPSYKPVFLPSEPRSHVITRPGILDGWEELVFRLMRYGVPMIASGTKQRLELQNMKVVITAPQPEDPSDLAAYGFRDAEFTSYQSQVLSPDLPEGLAYSYGNRLRAYWRDPHGGLLDSLAQCAARLQADPTSRGAYLALWDNGYDLIAPDHQSTPCLVSLFFRTFQDKLTLTACFRAHNTMSAWLKNVYGLMAARDWVAQRAGLEPGAITVISHSISIDPTSVERLELARAIAAAKPDDSLKDRRSGKRVLRDDPNGYFTFTLDPVAGEIIADLKADGETVTRYRGRTASAIEDQIARDEAITVLSHALYVGRQLTLLEMQLKARLNAAQAKDPEA